MARDHRGTNERFSREMPAPCTMKETRSSIAVWANRAKSRRSMAAIRFTPTKPPGASTLARRISDRSCAEVFTTPEMVPTPTSLSPR